MKLYFSPGACSLAPHIAAYELGLSFQAVKVNTKDKTYEGGGDYWKVNPKGSVPVIELDNGERLTEAAVILQYLADQKPEKNLIPKWGTWERYRAMEWLNFVSTEMHKGYSPLWNKEMPDDAKKIALDNLHKRYKILNPHFEANQFLLGNQFTVADPYLFTVLNWSRHLKIDLTPYPAIMGYIERVKSRPSTMEAMKAEGIWR